MTLKFRRNLPIVLMLVGILSLLALTIGNQQIVSYTINTNALQTIQLTGLFGTQNTDMALQFDAVQP